MRSESIMYGTEGFSCPDIDGFSLDLSTPEKKWGVKCVRLDLNTNRELQSKNYRDIYDNEFFRPSIGWTIRSEGGGYYCRSYPRSFLVAFSFKVNRGVQEKKLQHDPCKKFMPREDLILVRLLEKHMLCPDEEVTEMLEEIKKSTIRTEDVERYIATIITEQVEGLITSLAKHMFITKESIKISKDNRFTPEICKELTNRLGLDPYDPRPVLDQLYHELLSFVSLTPRERVWGKIVVEDSELKLDLKDNAFTFPDFDEILKDDKWIVT